MLKIATIDNKFTPSPPPLVGGLCIPADRDQLNFFISERPKKRTLPRTLNLQKILSEKQTPKNALLRHKSFRKCLAQYDYNEELSLPKYLVNKTGPKNTVK